jgi:hypothetical protein
MTDALSEAQDFQMIGQASPELDAIAHEKNGWQGDTCQDLIDERVSHEFSFWQQRANRQALGSPLPTHIDNMAGYHQTPTAAEPVQPFTYREEN